MAFVSTTQRGAAGPPDGNPVARTQARLGEKVVMSLLFVAGALTVVTTLGIVVVLFEEAFHFFGTVSDGGQTVINNDGEVVSVGLGRFFTDTTWRPFAPESTQFSVGVMALVQGTLLVTGIATLVAVPLGLLTAIYLSDFATPRARGWLKPTLEVLAGVPTVVLGFFALTVFTPFLQTVMGWVGVEVNIFNAASAGIVMGIMIVPTVASLSEDAMSAVPDALRQGAYGLGATKRQVVLRVVFPAALSGIVAAIILAIGRAIGETMIVAIAAGNGPIDFSREMGDIVNPFAQIQTMTAYIVQAVGGEAPRGSVTYQSIFAVGALLFAMTFSLNVLAQRIVRRFREAY